MSLNSPRESKKQKAFLCSEGFPINLKNAFLQSTETKSQYTKNINTSALVSLGLSLLIKQKPYHVCLNSLFFIFSNSSLQELSKIAMPVVFNEPLSFLQRLTEYMEHTYLIHQANATTDSIERMKVPFWPYILSSVK